jgi:hypothetical protein
MLGRERPKQQGVRDATVKITRQYEPWRKRSIRALAIFLFTSCPLLAAQNQDSASVKEEPTPIGKGVDYVLNYLNMAGTMKASEFRPLTQRERTSIYLKTMVNPLGYIKAGFSAGIDQWNDKPSEWEQGASGYGKRFANVVGQYSIQRTVTFGLASGLHEDNRYFNSGKKGIWSRTEYAVASGILARGDNGNRHLSVSQIGGVAAGAFLSRFWQPPSQESAGDGAVSFGITMASNMGFSVVKEFLPDLARVITRKRKSTTSAKQPRDMAACR